jgi:hypothetical protein
MKKGKTTNLEVLEGKEIERIENGEWRMEKTKQKSQGEKTKRKRQEENMDKWGEKDYKFYVGFFTKTRL